MEVSALLSALSLDLLKIVDFGCAFIYIYNPIRDTSLIITTRVKSQVRITTTNALYFAFICNSSSNHCLVCHSTGAYRGAEIFGSRHAGRQRFQDFSVFIVAFDAVSGVSKLFPNNSSDLAMYCFGRRNHLVTSGRDNFMSNFSVCWMGRVLGGPILHLCYWHSFVLLDYFVSST